MMRKTVARWLSLALTAILAPIIAAFGLFLWSTATADQERLREQVRTISANLRSDVDRELDGLVGTLQALATSPSLQVGDLAAFYQQASTVVAMRGSAIAIRRPDGQQLLNTYVAWGTPLPVSTDPVLRAADTLAMESRRPVISDLYIGAVAKKPFVLVVVPVSVQNEVRYLLNIAVEPQRFAMMLAARTDPHWLSAIVDGNFRVVARSRAHERYVNQPATPDIAIKVAANADWWQTRTLDGVASVVAYAPSQLAGWKILVSIPSNELARPIVSSFSALAAGALGSILAAIAVAVKFGHSLTFSIRSLVSTSTRLPSAAPKSGFVEIDEVSDTLRESSKQLVDTMSELRAAAEHRNVLIQEVAHRAQNMLATMQSVARFSLSNSDPAAAEAFIKRLQIMGKVNSALLKSELTGLPIIDVFEIGLGTFAGRVRLTGPPLQVVPKAVQILAMAVNELADASRLKGQPNAGNQVDLMWQIREETFFFTWEEEVSQPAPDLDGFAAFLLKKVVSLEFEASPVVESEGPLFRYSFTCPVHNIRKIETGPYLDA